MAAQTGAHSVGIVTGRQRGRGRAHVPEPLLAVLAASTPPRKLQISKGSSPRLAWAAAAKEG